MIVCFCPRCSDNAPKQDPTGWAEWDEMFRQDVENVAATLRGEGYLAEVHDDLFVWMPVGEATPGLDAAYRLLGTPEVTRTDNLLRYVWSLED